MIQQQVVYVSHPIRGKRRTDLRLADIYSVQSIVDKLRKESRVSDLFYTIVPYLLHAQVLEDQEQVAEYRVKKAGAKMGMDTFWYSELHLYGDELCTGMLAEIEHAQRNKRLIVPKDETMAHLLLSVL